jgi:L-threonylcarbamoyladenylate synthase
VSGVVPPGELAPVLDALRGGSVVAIPTDTVYGLAVDPARPGAVDALFALKGRPAGLSVAVLVADMAQADALAAGGAMPPEARRLALRFWPGALTLVVVRRAGLGWDLGGDPGTIGLRCPAHDLARELCRLVGPLATTSANRHGEAPLVTAEEVVATFGDQLVVVDGGRCDAAPSTVADTTVVPPRCLRTGTLAWEEVLAAAG